MIFMIAQKTFTIFAILLLVKLTKMDENRKLLNHMLPMYSQVARLKIQETEFEKTPKRSIKRYLYQ